MKPVPHNGGTNFGHKNLILTTRRPRVVSVKHRDLKRNHTFYSIHRKHCK